MGRSYLSTGAISKSRYSSPVGAWHWSAPSRPSVLSELSRDAELDNQDGLDVRLCYLRPTLPPVELRPEPSDYLSVDRIAKLWERLFDLRTMACDPRVDQIHRRGERGVREMARPASREGSHPIDRGGAVDRQAPRARRAVIRRPRGDRLLHRGFEVPRSNYSRGL